MADLANVKTTKRLSSVLSFCCGLVLMSCNFSANAQWYQTQGQAHVVDGDHATARTRATEDALKKALLVAGASVSSIKQVVNGLLTQDEISIRASGTVNSLELLDEIYQDDIVTVNIRADIFPQEKQCFAADYRKSILLTRSNLLNREQAKIGSIYAIDRSLMVNFAEQLRQQSSYLAPKLAIGSKTTFAQQYAGYQHEAIKDLAISLAGFTDSQYVLFSNIEDISFASKTNNPWQFWQQKNKDRHFNISLFLYDGHSGEQVFAQSYQNAAPWPYKQRQNADVTGTEFWQNSYGDMLSKTLQEASKDIDEYIMCQPSQATIVRATGNQITINLGKQHGVKLGDEFTVLHTDNFIADNGNRYASLKASQHKVRIVQVNSHSAQAITKNDELLGNIQIGDLAVRY